MTYKQVLIFVLLAFMAVGIFSVSVDASMRTWSEAILNGPWGTMTLPEGHVWPVVATYGYGPSEGGTYFLGPTGFTRSGNGGYKVFSGPNGELGVAKGFSVDVLHNGRWSTLSGGTYGPVYAGAFGSDGQISCVSSLGPESPVYYNVFTGHGWASSEISYSGVGWPGMVDIEVDSSGVVSVLAGHSFISQGVPGGGFSQVRLPGSGFLADLAISDSGMPGIVGMTADTVEYLTYDPQRLEWTIDVVTPVGMSGSPYPAAAVCFDNEGNPAVAYSANGVMHFAINDGSGGGWVDSIIGEFQAMRASLAFDRNNNPVACFSNPVETRIEYDPIMIPEPLTALLLMGGAIGVLRKRKFF